jgi:hypothetical protein
MKKGKLFSKSAMLAVVLLIGIGAFNSCKKKDDPIPTMTDVVNPAPAVKLKETIVTAPTLAALPTVFKTDAETVGAILGDTKVDAVNAVDLDPVVEFFKANIVITSAEVTKLKANDPYTFNTVINRMSQMPSFITEADLASLEASMEADAELDTYLLKATGSEDNLYSDNYYQAALDFQKYTTDYTIPMLQQVSALKKDANKSAPLETVALNRSQRRQIAMMVHIILLQQRTHRGVLIRLLARLHSGGTAS